MSAQNQTNQPTNEESDQMSDRNIAMVVFRLAVLLVFYWNLSLGHCLVGTIKITAVRRKTTPASTRKTIEATSPRGQGHATNTPTAHSTKAVTAAAVAKNLVCGTALGASSQQSSETPLTARVAFVSPASKERYRNLTRTVDYSIVHNDDYEYEYNYDYEVNKYNTVSRMQAMGDKDGAPPVPSAISSAPIADAFLRWLNSSRLAKKIILRSILLWRNWCVGKPMRVGKQLRCRKRFSQSDLGGTKRHYALLVASLVRGCHRPLGGDIIAYYRGVVESSHHQTIASLSSSTLSISEKKRIHVSSLEGHAIEWSLKHRRRRQLHQTKTSLQQHLQ